MNNTFTPKAPFTRGSIGAVLVACACVACGCIPFMPGRVDTRLENSSPPDSLQKDAALDRYLTGTVSEETGDLWKAAVYYQLAWLLDSTSATIPVSLADVYLKLGEVEAARIVLETGRRTCPENQDILERLVKIYLRANRLGDAAQALEDLAKVRELRGRELLQLGEIYTRTRCFDDALAVYGKFLTEHTPIAAVYMIIARIHIMRRDTASADTALRKVIEFDPHNQQALYFLGDFAVNRGDWRAAERYFREAVHYDSTEFRNWSNLLYVLAEQKKYEQTLPIIDLALDYFPDSPVLYELKGRSLQSLHRTDDALEAFDKSIEIDSTRTTPHMGKALLYHQIGKWDLSEAEYRQVLKLDPENALALNNYAYMLAERNVRLGEALDMAKKALEQSPDNSSYLDTCGWIYYRMGLHKKALGYIERALKSSPDNAELNAHLGSIYNALGKIKKARQAWRRAAELEPDNQEYRNLAR